MEVIMKKLLVLIFLGLSCSLVQTADAEKALTSVEDGATAYLVNEFEQVILDDQFIREALRFDLGLGAILEQPTNPLETTLRQHQLTIINFTLKKDHAGLFEYMKAELSKVDKDFWQFFTLIDSQKQNLPTQWSNLTFGQAQKIAQPFCLALKADFDEESIKVIGESFKGKWGTLQGGLLLPLFVQYKHSNKDDLQNFVEIITKWTSDKVSFEIMQSYFRREIDQANGLLKAKHLPDLTQSLLEIGLAQPVVEDALKHYDK